MVCYTFSFIVLIEIVVIVVGDGDGGGGGGGSNGGDGGGCSQIKLGDTNMRWHVLFVLCRFVACAICAVCYVLYVCICIGGALSLTHISQMNYMD